MDITPNGVYRIMVDKENKLYSDSRIGNIHFVLGKFYECVEECIYLSENGNIKESWMSGDNDMRLNFEGATENLKFELKAKKSDYKSLWWYILYPLLSSLIISLIILAITTLPEERKIADLKKELIGIKKKVNDLDDIRGISKRLKEEIKEYLRIK